jgi:SAM-dependent methyltransferase
VNDATLAAYTGPRHDLLELLPERCDRVLDIGCAEGLVGAEIRARRPGCEVWGIERDRAFAAVARTRLARVFGGDAEQVLPELRARGERFDLVVCGDILEHLVDPWAVLRTVRALCPDGCLLASLPNVGHWSTLWSLVWRSEWPYRDRGIHDRTHLRFFARRNVAELFGSAGFRLEVLRTRHRLLERPHPVNARLEPLLRALPGLARLTAFQFLCRAAPAAAGGQPPVPS